MRTQLQQKIARTREAERSRRAELARIVDGLCPYFREEVEPRNPLSFGTHPRLAIPAGDNQTIAVSSRLGL